MSDKKTIDSKIKELTELVSWFQGSDFELDKAVERFERAEELAKSIEKELMELKNKIEVVKKRFDE